MATKQQLSAIASAAFFFPGDSAKPAVSEVIDGVEYSVSYHIVKRKCYDSMATPTAMYKINGKRVSRAVYYGSAN